MKLQSGTNASIGSTPSARDELHFVLRDGINYVGSHHRNSIRLAPELSPDFLGLLIVSKDTVLFRVADGNVVTHNRRPVDNVLICSAGHSMTLDHMDFSFRVVREGNVFALVIFPAGVTA